jgi:basic amino acid/polyamine antiporter, APA family
MTDSHRDAGLKQALGFWGLSVNIFNMVVGATIFVVPALLAKSFGVYAPIAFVIAAVGVCAVGICFAEGGSRLPSTGGIYAYIEAVFGPLTGYVVGTLSWVSCVLASAGISAALADVVATVVPVSWAGSARALVIIAAIGCAALVNIGGIERGTRYVNVTTVVKVVPLVVFVIAGFTAIDPGHFAHARLPEHVEVGRSLILAMFALVGMDVSLNASGEVLQPARTIPRALGASMLAITALYVSVQVIAQGILGPALATSATPLADAMARVSPALRILLLAGSALSMIGYVNADMVCSPRMVFALARDGRLPRALGRLHERSRAPHVAIIAYAVTAIGLALSGSFAELSVLSALGTAAMYMIGCLAAWRLARKGVAQAGAPLNFRWLGAAVFVGVASMAAAIALASRAEILGLAALIAISVVGFFITTSERNSC